MTGYTFEMEIATEYGLAEAVFLHNIVFWVKTHMIQGTNYKDGRHWVFNSLSEFEEMYPFLTRNQLRRVITSLKDAGLILIGCYNKRPWDKTAWYTLSDKALALYGLKENDRGYYMTVEDTSYDNCVENYKGCVENHTENNKSCVDNHTTCVASHTTIPNSIPNSIHKDIVGLAPDHTSEKEKIPYQEVITYLNKKAGKNFRVSSEKTKKLIRARFNDGFTLDDFKRVIDTKVFAWGNDAKMSAYLRPETLFGTKFEGYLNETTSKNNEQDGSAIIDIGEIDWNI